MSSIMCNTKPKLYNPKRIEIYPLNKDKRRHDSARITLENQAFLRRLQQQQPTYSVTKWEAEYQKSLKIRSNMTEFPQALSQRNLRTMPEEDFAQDKNAQVRKSQDFRQSRNWKQPLIRQAESLPENRQIHYKQVHALGTQNYTVEISTSNDMLLIAGIDKESPESYLIELPTKRAEDILAQFDHSYERVAESLQVVNRRLVLLNPVSAFYDNLMQKFVAQRQAQ